jgi:hypothetical protein
MKRVLKIGDFYYPQYWSDGFLWFKGKWKFYEYPDVDYYSPHSPIIMNRYYFNNLEDSVKFISPKKEEVVYENS